jgi:L-alanine-DL-glutamate epimerase-like enolase superfamily enzyme
VEQPVARDDLDGLRRVTATIRERVIADESVGTPEEATRLASMGACDVFNIRVSKCGGLLRSARIARVARAAGLDCIVGAQVGESGILSAAGRHLAAAIGARNAEGSAGRLLLARELVAERVIPGRGGRAPVHGGPGLGVSVRERVLEEVAVLHRTVRPSHVEVH